VPPRELRVSRTLRKIKPVQVLSRNRPAAIERRHECKISIQQSRPLRRSQPHIKVETQALQPLPSGLSGACSPTSGQCPESGFGTVRTVWASPAHVFPDGELDCVSNIQLGMERAGFEIHDVEGLRPHPALTLRNWV